MACPLSALIEARFTDFSQEGKDYPNVSVLEKKFVSQEVSRNVPRGCGTLPFKLGRCSVVAPCAHLLVRARTYRDGMVGAISVW